MDMKKTKFPFYMFIFSISFFAFLTLYTNISENYDWQKVIEKSQHAVVQILSQRAEFNFKEPFRSPQGQQHSGTGFFINENGYLLTNYHVIEQAKSVQIALPALGRRAFDAQVIGVCPESDIALLAITKDDLEYIKKQLGQLQYLELGNSDSLYATEPVLALGFPLGQRYLKSTTGGVAGRDYINEMSYVHITAPLNPGNSGGPLLNKEGKVVGINTAIIQNSQNICFIVPINQIKTLLPELYKTKLVRKPKLGIYSNPTTEEHAKCLKCPTPAGIYVNDIEKDFPADKAGIKAGDVLYKINNYQIDQFGDVSVDWGSDKKASLGEFLNRVPLNESLKFSLYRNEKQHEITCKMTNSKFYPIRYIYPDFESEEIDYEMIGGLCIMQLRLNHLDLPFGANLQEYRNVDKQNQQILIITNILPGSCIHKINCFYEGILLDKVNNKEVKTLSDLRLALNDSIKSGNIEFLTKDKITTVVSLKKILQDEDRLAKDFIFSITPTVEKLKKLCFN